EQQDGGEADLYRLTGGTLPHHRADAALDVAGVPPVAYRPVHVTENATGQGGVQEHRAVAVRHRGPQRQPDAQPTGDEAPPPGRGDRGERADAERECERLPVDES